MTKPRSAIVVRGQAGQDYHVTGDAPKNTDFVFTGSAQTLRVDCNANVYVGGPPPGSCMSSTNLSLSDDARVKVFRRGLQIVIGSGATSMTGRIADGISTRRGKTVSVGVKGRWKKNPLVTQRIDMW